MIIERPPLYGKLEVMDYADVIVVGEGIHFNIGTVLQLLVLENVESARCMLGDAHGNITMSVKWDHERRWVARTGALQLGAQVILSKCEDPNGRTADGLL